MIVTIYLAGGPFDNELHPMIWPAGTVERLAKIGAHPVCIYEDAGHWVSVQAEGEPDKTYRKYNYIGRMLNGYG